RARVGPGRTRVRRGHRTDARRDLQAGARRRRRDVHGRRLDRRGAREAGRNGRRGMTSHQWDGVDRRKGAEVPAFGKVAVLMGGRSAEREVSLMSGSGVLKALQSKGIDAHAFDPAERDLSELKRKDFKRCFIALHGRFGEDGTVQGALELLGIPYTGSGVMASSVSIDKVMTKRIWIAEGIPTPKYQLLRRGVYTREIVRAVPDDLGLPL